MAYEDMSREQLVELLAEQNGGGENGDAEPAAPLFRTVEIEGIKITINGKRASSWPAFRKLSALTDGITPEAINGIMDFITFVTDVDEATIVEHCGGDEAQVTDVVRVANEILAACYPEKK